jgi:metallo-beta-lactamase class B
MKRFLIILTIISAAAISTISIRAQPPQGSGARGDAPQDRPVRTDAFYHTVWPNTTEVVPPFKMFDNLYYIGTNDAAAYLIKTNAGLIMVDTLFDKFVDHLVPAIQDLGLNVKDVKYVILSHSHPDHWGGAKMIQELTGARVLMAEADWQELEKLPPTNMPTPPRRDMVVKDGDTLTLGETTLKLWVTPGHTPGVVSIEFPVYENGKQYKAFFNGGYRFGGGPEVIRTGIASLERLLGPDGPKNVDVNLYCHQWSAAVLQRGEQLKSRKPGDPNPFVVPGEFATLTAFRLKEAQDALANPPQRGRGGDGQRGRGQGGDGQRGGQ